MKTFSELVCKSILAGIFIAIGGYAYLAVGGIIGAILFSFGLLSVVTLGTPLYTGTAGFKFKKYKKWMKLPTILLANVVGCFLIGFVSHLSPKELDVQAVAI